MCVKDNRTSMNLAAISPEMDMRLIGIHPDHGVTVSASCRFDAVDDEP